jgi:hypothetical protein
LREAEEMAMLVGSRQPVNPAMSPRNSWTMPDCSFSKGREALLGAAFMNNYISGTVYNREIIGGNQLFERVWENIDRHYIYPHLYLEAFLCTQGKVRAMSEVLSLEGEAEISTDQLTVSGQKMEGHESEVYSFEGRLDQHKLFSDVVKEIAYFDIDEDTKGQLYLKICEKTLRMVGEVNGPAYFMKGRDLPVLLERACRYCLQLLQEGCIDARLRPTIKVMIKDQYLQKLASVVESFPILQYARNGQGEVALLEEIKVLQTGLPEEHMGGSNVG